MIATPLIRYSAMRTCQRLNLVNVFVCEVAAFAVGVVVVTVSKILVQYRNRTRPYCGIVGLPQWGHGTIGTLLRIASRMRKAC